MLVGGPYWRLINSVWANLIVRFVFGFLTIVLIFASVPESMRWAAFGFMLFIDFSVMGLAVIIQVQFAELSRKLWMDHLADRIFYRMLFEEIRSGNRLVDVDGLFQAASREASEDIKSADEEGAALRTIQTRWLSRTVGVSGHILQWFFNVFVGYGAAAVLANMIG